MRCSNNFNTLSLQANLTDNCDGTYALQFSLALAGDWALSASVGGQEVPWPEAAQLRAEYAPLAAQDCEISGVDGLVSCGTSDPIFIQVSYGIRARVLQIYADSSDDLDSTVRHAWRRSETLATSVLSPSKGTLPANCWC